LRGEVDLTTAPILEEAMRRAINRGRHIVLDLSDLTYIASAGLHVFFNGYERLNGRRKRILLAAPSPSVRKILEIVGLHRVFALVPSLDEAWRTLHVV
jgi:anti-anti-sigma factor